jgi:hypothetical protein
LCNRPRYPYIALELLLDNDTSDFNERRDTSFVARLDYGEINNDRTKDEKIYLKRSHGVSSASPIQVCGTHS